MADSLEYINKNTISPGFEATFGQHSISSPFFPTHSTVDVSSQDVSVVSSLSMLASTSENSKQLSITFLDQLVVPFETVESPTRTRKVYDPQVTPQ